MKKIVLTGGGTAGHVTPNLALLPSLRERGYEIHYIGSYNGIEKKLIEGAGIPYDGISSGKLRRYFDIKNFSDPFRVIKGYAEARSLLKKYRPDVVFSKGGFVSVPVVLAAKHFKIPTIIHESDMTPGPGQQDLYPVRCQGMLQLPGDLTISAGRQSRPHRIPNPPRAAAGRPSDRPQLHRSFRRQTDHHGHWWKPGCRSHQQRSP